MAKSKVITAVDYWRLDRRPEAQAIYAMLDKINEAGLNQLHGFATALLASHPAKPKPKSKAPVILLADWRGRRASANTVEVTKEIHHAS